MVKRSSLFISVLPKKDCPVCKKSEILSEVCVNNLSQLHAGSLRTHDTYPPFPGLSKATYDESFEWGNEQGFVLSAEGPRLYGLREQKTDHPKTRLQPHKYRWQDYH